MTMYLDPHSFDAHVRHEHRPIVRYVARTMPVDHPFVVDLTESVSRIVMCQVRKMNACCRFLYWTCRCLEGYTSTEFAYANEDDAEAVDAVIRHELARLNVGEGGVDLSIMLRIDIEGEACTCPYSYGKHGPNPYTRQDDA